MTEGSPGWTKADYERAVAVLSPWISASRQARIEAVLAAKSRDVVVLLEDLYDEHNAAAVMRSVDAFGLLEVQVLEAELPFELSRKVSLGAHKWLEVKRQTAVDAAFGALKARGYQIWASDLHGDAVALEDLPLEGKIALVFGNEHKGVSEAALKRADGRFVIPMQGFVESLNISVAAAVSLYEVTRKRRQAGTLAPLDPTDGARVKAAWYARSVRSAPQLLAREGLGMPLLNREPLQVRERGEAEAQEDPEHPSAKAPESLDA